MSRQFDRENVPIFLRFTAVGAVGFAVDTGILYLLMHSVDVLFARCASLFCSMLTTWLLNRMFTFGRGAASRKLWAEVGCYLTITLTGACINYLTFALFLVGSPVLLRQPVVAVAAGTGVALFWNYIALRRFLYRG